MSEIYYVPTTKWQKLTLGQLAAKFAAAGLPCKIEPVGEDMFWLAFDPFESDILASVADGVFVFGTFNFHHDDDTTIGETVDLVMTSIGFSTEEGADYLPASAQSD